MKDKPSVLRPTDDEARQLARQLMAEAPWVALAVLEPATGWPSISRTIIALDEDGVPFILVSALAAHTGALKTDGRCSFLAGEPGKGIRLPIRASASRHRRFRLRVNIRIFRPCEIAFSTAIPKHNSTSIFPISAFFA